MFRYIYSIVGVLFPPRIIERDVENIPQNSPIESFSIQLLPTCSTRPLKIVVLVSVSRMKYMNGWSARNLGGALFFTMPVPAKKINSTFHSFSGDNAFKYCTHSFWRSRKELSNVCAADFWVIIFKDLNISMSKLRSIQGVRKNMIITGNSPMGEFKRNLPIKTVINTVQNISV